MANLAIRKVHKSYGKTQVVHGVDLDSTMASSWSFWDHLAVASRHCCG